MERYDKYIVVKRFDVLKYLSFSQEFLFQEFLVKIESGRTRDGKAPKRYVVVGEDQPYAETVWQLIEEAEDAKDKEVTG